MGEAKRREMDAPIPSLREWLGDGCRADGFEGWVAECLAAEKSVTDASQRTFIRIMSALAVAAVEACQREDKLGVEFATIVTFIARAAGVTVASAVASGCKEDADLRSLSNILIDEFRRGVRHALHSVEKARR